LVRAVADVPLLVGAISEAMAAPLSPLDGAPRLGLCRTELWRRAAPDARADVEAVAERLAAAGAEMRDVDLGPAFVGLAEAQATIMAAEAAESFRFERERHRDLLSPALHTWLDEGARTPAERVTAAHTQADRCRAAFPAAISGCDALLTLSAPGEAPAGLDSTGDPAFNRMWTLLHVPCLSLPAATGVSGLPIGVQLIGRVGGDAALLSVAAWAEQSLGLVRAVSARVGGSPPSAR
jgi:Asp-tRNA(Asn)/Glu-tRNA(Gln) amidotransferase A subunit family amidase